MDQFEVGADPPFEVGDRIEYFDPERLDSRDRGTVGIAKDYNGDAHIDFDKHGVGIVAPKKWHLISKIPPE